MKLYSYDVKISCLGHTFNVRGVTASNMDDAASKAERFVKSKVYVSHIQEGKSESGKDGTVVDFLKNMLNF